VWFNTMFPGGRGHVAARLSEPARSCDDKDKEEDEIKNDWISVGGASDGVSQMVGLDSPRVNDAGVEGQLQDAMHMEQSGEVVKAAKMFEDLLLTTGGNHAPTLVQYGLLLSRQGQQRAALPLLRRAASRGGAMQEIARKELRAMSKQLEGRAGCQSPKASELGRPNLEILASAEGPHGAIKEADPGYGEPPPAPAPGISLEASPGGLLSSPECGEALPPGDVGQQNPLYGTAGASEATEKSSPGSEGSSPVAWDSPDANEAAPIPSATVEHVNAARKPNRFLAPSEEMEDWDDEDTASPSPKPANEGHESDWDEEASAGPEKGDSKLATKAPPKIETTTPEPEEWEEWDSEDSPNPEEARQQDQAKDEYGEETEIMEMSNESDWDDSDDDDQAGREDMLLSKYEGLLRILRATDGDVSAVPEGFFDGLGEEEVQNVFEAVQQDLDAESDFDSDSGEDEGEDRSELLAEKYEQLLEIMVQGDGDPSSVPEGFFEGLVESEIEQMFDAVETAMEARNQSTDL